MSDESNIKSRKKRKKKIKLRYVALVGLGIYIVVFFFIQAYNIYNLKNQQEELNQRIKALEAEKEILIKQYNSINSLEYIEEMARENLRMVKPNEVLYVDTTLEKEGYEQEKDEE